VAFAPHDNDIYAWYVYVPDKKINNNKLLTVRDCSGNPFACLLAKIGTKSPTAFSAGTAKKV